MSDQQQGKKFEEEIALELFNKEYKHITGLYFENIENSEQPDFIVYRSDGLKLGIELTKVMRDPESAFWDNVFKGEDFFDPLDSLLNLQILILAKDEKRSNLNWKLPNRTILLLQLMDSSLQQVFQMLDEKIIKELNSTGFFEIWVGDYTILEAYGTIQLCCIKPQIWQGLYNHINIGKKPYG